MLTPREVISWSRIDASFPTCDINDIDEAVRYEFETCLGPAFYKELVDHLNDYSDGEDWHGGDYSAGDVVIYKGVYWIANVDTNTEPTCSNDWQLAEKFDKECLNNLWCEGSLARYLALVVVKDTIPHAATKVTAGGIVKLFGEGFQQAGQSDVKLLQAAYNTKIQKSFELLDLWIKRNNSEGCFDKYKGLDNGCCDQCGCQEEECQCGCITAKKTKNRYLIG